MTKTQGLKIYVLTGLIIFTLLLIIVYIMLPGGKPVTFIKTDQIYDIIEDGDIICRLGDRLWSAMFKDFSIEDKRFSHIGIIQIVNDQVNVIHAEGTTKPEKDFVKAEPLADFLKVARSIGIYRLDNIKKNKISDLAMEYINVPFDWQFDMSDESKLYCTELLYVVLKRLMPDLELRTIFVKEIKKDIIPIDSISNSEYFSEILFISNL